MPTPLLLLNILHVGQILQVIFNSGSPAESELLVGSPSRGPKPGTTATGHFRLTQPVQMVAQKGPAAYLLSEWKVWDAANLLPLMPPQCSSMMPSTSEPPETVDCPQASPRVKKAAHVPVVQRHSVSIDYVGSAH